MTSAADRTPDPDTAPRADAGATFALTGVRVVEVGQLIAGPFCGQLLADLGADVVKLEQPVVGDPMRSWGNALVDGRSVFWPILARGKKSVTCNLRVEQGQAILRQLVADADILIENFRAGTLERWGLGPEDLAQINPGLIVVRVSGYGQTGPYASRPGYGAIGEAMGGLRYLSGDPDRTPSRVGVSIGDSLAGLFATIGALSALHARQTTGRGQVVDMAIYEAVMAVMESLIPEYELAGFTRERTGSILERVAPSNIYATRDQTLVLIAANQDTVWRRLAKAMGQPELADDERFRDHVSRGDRQAELDALIADWTATLTGDELLAVLDEHAVPCGLLFRAKEMLEDPHIAARKAIVRIADPVLGEVPMQAIVPRLSDTPGEIRWTGPALGQHTAEVLRERLGIGAEELAELQSAGVV